MRRRRRRRKKINKLCRTKHFIIIIIIIIILKTRSSIPSISLIQEGKKIINEERSFHSCNFLTNSI